MAEMIYQKMFAISNRHLCGATDAPENASQLQAYITQLHRITTFAPQGIILREKDLTEEAYEVLAKEVLRQVGSSDTPLILHYFTDVAIRLGVSRIHLPLPVLQNLADTEEGLAKLQKFSGVSTSVHSVEEAQRAEQLGASFVLAGNVYETDCKVGLPGRGLPFIRKVVEAVAIPVYALGGIDEKNCRECMDAGAAGGAMMSGFMKL